jgi:RNA polymerase sigma-70 factor, ECF subfamily
MLPSDEAGALFSTYHDRICRYVFSLVHDPAEAEDLTQDTFLRAYAHRDALRDPNAVRGWLYQIATHVSLDRLRQRVAQVSLDGEEGASVDALPSQSPSALEIAERQETAPASNAALTSFSIAIVPSFCCTKLTR